MLSLPAVQQCWYALCAGWNPRQASTGKLYSYTVCTGEKRRVPAPGRLRKIVATELTFSPFALAADEILSPFGRQYVHHCRASAAKLPDLQSLRWFCCDCLAPRSLQLDVTAAVLAVCVHEFASRPTLLLAMLTTNIISCQSISCGVRGHPQLHACTGCTSHLTMCASVTASAVSFCGQLDLQGPCSRRLKCTAMQGVGGGVCGRSRLHAVLQQALGAGRQRQPGQARRPLRGGRAAGRVPG